MIQLSRSDVTTLNNVYLNLYDEMTNADYNVLISVTSQLTGKTKSFRSVTTYTNKDRYLHMLIYVATSMAGENLGSGIVFLGSTDYPLGFYDVTIYQNNNNTNLDPANAIKTIYKGLVNLSATNAVAPVGYTEYTTNDSDTESVYITI